MSPARDLKDRYLGFLNVYSSLGSLMTLGLSRGVISGSFGLTL